MNKTHKTTGKWDIFRVFYILCDFVGDFGFASQKNLYSTSLGTYPYMAPEFFRDVNHYGKEVDIWAAGNF